MGLRRRLQRLEAARAGGNVAEPEPGAWPGCNVHSKTPAEIAARVDEVLKILVDVGAIDAAELQGQGGNV